MITYQVYHYQLVARYMALLHIASHDNHSNMIGFRHDLVECVPCLTADIIGRCAMSDDGFTDLHMITNDATPRSIARVTTLIPTHIPSTRAVGAVGASAVAEVDDDDGGMSSSFVVCKRCASVRFNVITLSFDDIDDVAAVGICFVSLPSTTAATATGADDATLLSLLPSCVVMDVFRRFLLRCDDGRAAAFLAASSAEARYNGAISLCTMTTHVLLNPWLVWH